MIPGSYFFRDAYDRRWNMPETEEEISSEEGATGPRSTITAMLRDLVAGAQALALPSGPLYGRSRSWNG